MFSEVHIYNVSTVASYVMKQIAEMRLIYNEMVYCYFRAEDSLPVHSDYLFHLEHRTQWSIRVESNYSKLILFFC